MEGRGEDQDGIRSDSRCSQVASNKQKLPKMVKGWMDEMREAQMRS
jgi:hypothetical protein